MLSKSEGKVITAEKFSRRKAVNKHLLHKILRRQAAERIKGCLLIFLDAQPRDAGVLLRQREVVDKGVFCKDFLGVIGMLMKERIRGGNSSAVAAVDAVKVAERHGTALRGVDRRQALVDLHWLSAPFAK